MGVSVLNDYTVTFTKHCNFFEADKDDIIQKFGVVLLCLYLNCQYDI